MGTTSTSGWAMFWYLSGFMTLVTSRVGAGAFGILGGAAQLGLATYLFLEARKKEEV